MLEQPVEVGILTKGKPTLAMVLTNLLMADCPDLSILIVDTAETPVIERDDVLFALKLAQDRKVPCEYQRSRDRNRAFTAGRLALLEQLRGPYICYMDDDVVISSSSLTRIMGVAQDIPDFGYIAPRCVNAGASRGFLADKPHYSPGGVFRQDELVRDILLDYYESTVDVLDTQSAADKVWELAFLTELFPALGRPCLVQEDNVSYHLDYHESLRWELMEQRLARTSRQKLAQLLTKHCPTLVPTS
ncbi:MAG: glycosyltransferase family 2 protein [Chloroflexi bacterium]|nr:glycosyltransferase family 2 protein [Chloroflexota bacterium]